MTVAQEEQADYYRVRVAKTGSEIKLAMQRLWLTGQVTPFGARLLAEHTFKSGESRPLEVVYAFMLPRDAALRSFRVTGEGFEVTSDLQPVEQAMATYEEGVDAGSTSVLARQYTDGLMNLTVGNLQPDETVRVILEIIAGVERHDDGFRFRFPFTLAPSYHAQMRAVTTPQGGEIELPREEFGDLVLPIWKEDASDLHGVGFDLELLGGQELAEVRSPSHGITVAGEGSERRVGLAVEGELPDRDLVLEAKVDEPWALAWSGGGSISALLGSTRFGEPDDEAPKSVVFVLDRSASMEGRPLDQATKAIEAGIAALRPRDQFSIVTFDHETWALSKGLLAATDTNRQRARKALEEIESGGGTELASGVARAARIFEGEGGDLLLLTDGQVFGTPDILRTARETGARIHALGIGSASQDRFLASLGRETGGQSRFLTARERVDMAVLELFASITPAVASGVEIAAGNEVLATQDVCTGRPVFLRHEIAGEALGVSWDSGSLQVPVVEASATLGETLRLLDGAARITSAESRFEGAPVGEEAVRLEDLSRQYGLASRAMALVAVIERSSDQPGEMPVTRVVPVGMPQDLQGGAYFHGIAAPEGPTFAAMGSSSFAGIALEEDKAPYEEEGYVSRADLRAHQRVMQKRFSKPSLIRRIFASDEEEPDAPVELTPPWIPMDDEERLLDDASRLEADGGMPGDSQEKRIEASLDLLERLAEHGSTRAKGPFRHHVRRLLEFLEDAELSDEQEERLAEIGPLVGA